MDECAFVGDGPNVGEGPSAGEGTAVRDGAAVDEVDLEAVKAGIGLVEACL